MGRYDLSSGVLHYRPSDKGLLVDSDAYYHKLIHFAHKHRSHYDKSVKRCGPLLMHEKAHKYMTNQTEEYYSTLNPPYNPDIDTNI